MALVSLKVSDWYILTNGKQCKPPKISEHPSSPNSLDCKNSPFSVEQFECCKNSSTDHTCNKKLVSKNFLNKEINKVQHDCDIFPLAKQSEFKFPVSNSKTIKLFELIHLDIWGKFPIKPMMVFPTL